MADNMKKDRPYIPDYGINKNEEGLLDWEFVEKNMKDGINYWLSTTNPNGNPHSIPLWGIWYNSILYFGGGPKTRYMKNIKRNPSVVAHTESGLNVVIIEGEISVENDNNIIIEIQKLYKEKYKIDHPPPFYKVKGNKILAWTMDDYAKTPTRWLLK